MVRTFIYENHFTKTISVQVDRVIDLSYMTKKMTQKQKDFVVDVQETFDPVKSVQRTYGYNKEVAQKNANKLLKAPNIRDLMNDSKIGLDDRHLLDRLKKALKASRLVWSKSEERWLEDVDWTTQIKALELAFKLKGYLSSNYTPDEGSNVKQITVNFNLVKARDVDEVKRLMEGTIIDSRQAILEKTNDEKKSAANAVLDEVEEDGTRVS